MKKLKEARILVVDDQEPNVLLLERMLEQQGFPHVISTTDSSKTVGYFEEDPPDLLLLDLQMPQPDGFEVMELVKRWTSSETYVPILVLTADASHETRLRALEAGARDFVSKPFDFIEVSLRIRNLLQTRMLQLKLQSANDLLEERVRHRTRELEQARTEAFQRLGMAAEYRDDDTGQHAQRVGFTAELLATELGLDAALVDVIGRITPLHDLGKIGIPDAILLKPGKLTDDEWTIMQTHVTIGADVLGGSSSPVLDVAAEIALTHHERWDGHGYPAGLTGKQIPISGRIVALADSFDAMTHPRPYKGAMPLAEAVAEIERSAGSHFDPAVVAAFGRLDPELLMSPPPADPRPSVTSEACATVRGLTGITHDGSQRPTDAILVATFADTPTAALIADDDRRYVSANVAACEMLGLELDELLELRIDDLAPPDVRPQLDAMWSEFMDAGVQTADYELLLPDGTALAATYRGVAHFLPGRHLSLLTPKSPAPSGMLDGLVMTAAEPQDVATAEQETITESALRRA